MQRATSRSSRVQPPVPSALKASFALSSGSNRAEEAGESNITSTMRCVPAFSNVGSRKARSSPLMSLMMRERPCSKLAKADKMATRRLLPSPLSARMQAWTESMSLTLFPISPTTSVPPEGLSPSCHDLLLRLSSPCAEMSLASPWMGAPGARRPPTQVPSWSQRDQSKWLQTPAIVEMARGATHPTRKASSWISSGRTSSGFWNMVSGSSGAAAVPKLVSVAAMPVTHAFSQCHAAGSRMSAIAVPAAVPAATQRLKCAPSSTLKLFCLLIESFPSLWFSRGRVRCPPYRP